MYPNSAHNHHPQTPRRPFLFPFVLLLLVLRQSTIRLSRPPRPLNSTKMKSKTRRTITVPRIVFCMSNMHWVYSPFAHLNVAIAGRVYMEWLTLPWLSLNPTPRNRHHPWIPSRQSSHLLFLHVLPVPKGNSSRTKARTRTPSIRRERYLNFRASSALL